MLQRHFFPMEQHKNEAEGNKAWFIAIKTVHIT